MLSRIDPYQEYTSKKLLGTDGKKGLEALRKPLRATAKWFSETQPEKYKNICTGLRVSDHGCKIDYEDEEPVWSIPDVLEFLDGLGNNHHLSAGVALQGLAAFRLTEAQRLSWDGVNLEAHTITISGKVKNKPSVRKILIVQRLVEILKSAKVNGAEKPWDMSEWTAAALGLDGRWTMGQVNTSGEPAQSRFDRRRDCRMGQPVP